MTSREACGDTVRNVVGCHLAGACPFEVLDITPWAEATARYLLRHPYSQRLPRKFKINFSGCKTDCGQAMFNDVGVVATARTLDDGTLEPGFKIFLAGGLGANPHPAQALEEFTPREDLLPTIEAILRTFDHYGNRDNKIRARMKWLVDTMGIEELRERIVKERKFLRARRVRGRAGSRSRCSTPATRPRAARRRSRSPPTVCRCNCIARDPAKRWEDSNVVRGVAKGTVSVYAYARLGDITTEQFRRLADIQRDFALDVRITNRQNFVLRDLTEADLTRSVRAARRHRHGRGRRRARPRRRRVPGRRYVQPRGHAVAAASRPRSATRSRKRASPRYRACASTSRAARTAAASTTSPTSASSGSNAARTDAAAPGYQMLLGGRLGDTEVEFGDKAAKLPARSAPEAVVRIVRQFAGEREAGETFSTWLDRSGGASGVGATVKDLDHFPAPDVGPEFYVDFGETGPYVAEVGEGECAAT